ncbi:hypothetical protein LJC63_12220 [Ruminococcaceae bacterium OttesenSCG-928-L11]|nr:hypothetical protein [Ruminococcaceae bacterium OttesenSCG-928-L11]
MKIIAFASGSGGAGKSVTAAYTGVALAKEGKRVLLMEMGASPRSQDVILGLAGQSLFHIRDFLDMACDFDSLVCQSAAQPGLSVVLGPPAGLTRPIDGDSLSTLLSNVPDTYEYVLLDSVDFTLVPPSLVDTVLVVAEPLTLSIRSAATLVAALEDAGAGNMRLIINRVPAEILPMRDVGDFDDVVDMVGARLIGVVPESRKLCYAANNTERLADDSITPQVYRRIARRLLGHNEPLLIR